MSHFVRHDILRVTLIRVEGGGGGGGWWGGGGGRGGPQEGEQYVIFWIG